MEAFLRERADNGLISWPNQRELAEKTGLTLHEVEEFCLGQGVMPVRYQRNRNALEVKDQYTLCRARVAVAGCGGLGGYVVEELARIGVGTITVCDPDSFAEHNLNRQLFSAIGLIGISKVEAAQKRIAEVNPAVNLVARELRIEDILDDDLKAHNVVVDALDSIPDRLHLAARCRRLGIPLVHGAIGGWYGQVLTQLPGDERVEKFYRPNEPAQGVEKELGNPSFVAPLIASLQVAEVIKVLLGQGKPLSSRMLFIDLSEMAFDTIKIK